MPKISVIIPVYKVEKYLRRCLDSLIAQSFSDWQAICVDDGSPDSCPKILDEYAARDSRFKVIHKKNAGVSAARNDGIKNADADYIHFLDADDWIDADFYAHMLTVAMDANADMVVSGFVSDNNITSDDTSFQPRAPKPVQYMRTQNNISHCNHTFKIHFTHPFSYY